MPLSDWCDGFAHRDAQDGWPAIYDRGYLQASIAGGEGFDWYCASDAERVNQVRTPITDGAYAKPWVFRPKDLRAWWTNAHYDRPGGIESATPTQWIPQSKPIWFTELGCPAIDRGTNQPNVFFDPKAAESVTPTSRFDHGNALIINLISGTLDSVTDVTLLGGANALAIESTPGVWEIVQAGVAKLIAPGRYRLSRLLRGQRGTEAAMGQPTPAGARALVLDDSVAALPIAEADLGLPWNWRIGPAAKPVNDETYVAQAFTPEGVGLRPFSAVHVAQPWRRARSPGDLTIRWIRRDRALGADSWNAVEIPMSETSETWAVEILDPGSSPGQAPLTVKRVLAASTTSALYTAAEQTTDWGGPLGPGATLTVRIVQLSTLIGSGTPTTVTLSF